MSKMEETYEAHLVESITSGMEVFLEIETLKEYLINLPISELESLNETISKHLLGISGYNKEVIRRLIEETKDNSPS